MDAGRKTTAAVVAFLSACALGLAACGSGGGGDEPTSTPSTTAATTGTLGGDAQAGAAVWEEANCGGCHTLETAGSTGAVGPNLDDLKPDFTTIVTQVTNGGSGMPAFGDSLTAQQINDVAAYVVRSTGG